MVGVSLLVSHFRSQESPASCAQTTATLSRMLCGFSDLTSSSIDHMSSQRSRQHRAIKGTYLTPVIHMSSSRHRRLCHRRNAASSVLLQRLPSSAGGHLPVGLSSPPGLCRLSDGVTILKTPRSIIQRSCRTSWMYGFSMVLLKRLFQNLTSSRLRHWNSEMPSVSFQKGKAVTTLPWPP